MQNALIVMQNIISLRSKRLLKSLDALQPAKMKCLGFLCLTL